MELLELTAENIDRASTEIVTFLTRKKADSKSAQRIRIAAEDLLLKYMNLLDGDAQFRVICSQRFFRLRVMIRVYGACADPFADMDEGDWLLRKVMEDMGQVPAWSYSNGANTLLFSLDAKRKIPAYFYTLAAVVLGIAFGYASRLLPGETGSAVFDSFLSPVSSAIMGLLSALASILIFVSVVNGICGMGDMATFNRIGKRMLGRFLGYMLCAALLSFVVCLVFFPMDRSGKTTVDFAGLWAMLLGIIPGNVVEAFLSGNALQIIFLAVFSGIVLLMLSEKIRMLTEVILQIDRFIQKMLEIVIRLMPLVVFISLSRLTMTSSIADLIGVFKFPMLVLASCAAMLLFSLLRTVFTQRVSPGVLLKKLLPTYLISLSTASSSASFSTNMKTSEKDLGVDRQIVSVGVPLGQTLFRPSTICNLMFGCMCLAEMNGVGITFSKLFSLMITAYILGVAQPPIPGSAISSFTLLFAQFGIPADAISMIVALDPLTDRIVTSTRISLIQLELTQLAASLNLLDRRKLRAGSQTDQ